MEKKYIIYQHKNLITNQSYIGQTCQKPNYRWKNGKGYKTQEKFWEAIEEFGWDNFEHTILEENISENDIDEKEKYWIKKFDAVENGYNSNYGGHHYIANEETKEKIRQANLGEKNPNYGKPKSEEVKEKIRQSNLGQKRSAEVIEHNRQAQLGKILTEEHKRHISEGLKGHLVSEEVREKIKNNQPNKKSVICIETQEIFNSVADAAQWCHLSGSAHISAVCKGKRKTAGGYHWQYVEKEENN